jgi:hypothetical protein
MMLKKGSGLALHTDNRGVRITQFDQKVGYVAYWATGKCLSDFWLGYETSIFIENAEDSRVCLIKDFIN